MEQDLLKKPLKQEFDLVVVCRVLHHMPDLDATLSLFHQHLKEDGQLLLADFTKTEANHHGFDLAELEKQLIEHGFHLCIIRSSTALKTCFRELLRTLFNSSPKITRLVRE